MLLTNEEFDALNTLIILEQIDIIDDEENEFWNTIRRKLCPQQNEHLSST
jgi:hypothetical protein